MKGSNLLNYKYSFILLAIVFFILTFLIYSLTKPDPLYWVLQLRYDYFVWLADAFLHGRLHIIDPHEGLGELVPVAGKLYVIYPPIPAIVLIPFVAIFGTTFSQAIGSIIFGSFNVSLFYLLMRRLTKDKEIQVWMTLLFAFGTIHWYLASWGAAWYFAQVISFSFLTLSIYETFTKRRPFLIGLLLGASYWSRLSTILSLPFFILMLSDEWLKGSKDEPILKRINVKPIFFLICGAGIFVLLNFIYNYLRFGTPLDVAYTMLKVNFQPEFNKGSFSLSYIPLHLSVFLFKLPGIIKDPPFIVPSMAGQSLFLTTPAFLYSFFAGLRNKISLACWLGILPVALLIFSKSGTGWIMFGYRYAMDFYPFLLILVVRGIGDSIRWHHRVLISLSILINLWGVICINKFAKFVWW